MMTESTKLGDAAILLIAMQHDLGSMDKVWLPNKAWRDNVLAFARDLIDGALAAAPSATHGDAQTAEVMRILADHGIGMCDGETVYPHEGEDAEQYMGAIRAIVARFAAAPAAPQREAPRAALPEDVDQRFSLFCRECDKLPAQCRCK
jgi:hypothetical protein